MKELIASGYLKTPEIIDAFRAIDRADFILPEYQNEAYGNYPLPIGTGQTISQPLTVAFMLELLEPKPGEKILDVGAGSGWTTALLAHIVRQEGGNRKSRIMNKGVVYGIERIPEICKFGQKNLARYFPENIAKIFCKDGTEGLVEYAPYDKILASAAASQEIPQSWRDQLKVGGRIVAPVGSSIWRFIKRSETEWDEEEHPGFAFVPLVRKLEVKSYESGKDVTSRKKKKIFLISYFLLLVFVVLFVSEISFPHPASQEKKTVEIIPGLGSRKIGELLEQEGIVRSKWVFVTYVSLFGKADRLLPGTYQFHNMAIPAIVRDLTDGGDTERTITIPEGWTNSEIAVYFNREGIAEEKDFLAVVGNDAWHAFSERFAFLRGLPDDATFEGFLFPDTYRIYRTAGVENIIGKMLENFEKKITPDLHEEMVRQKKTIFDIVRMASLIEEEVRTDEDRTLVSGILWKRLAFDIPLQVDATIAYAKSQIKNLPRTEVELLMRGHQSQKRITIEDTKINSPYNTYRNRGLPKGPIANPGISAIRAAIYPKKSPYLYYLSAPDGTTIFSRTLEEHNAAKVMHLK